MAIPALSVGSYNRLKSQLAQYRATTGRDPSPQILQALMETDVSQAQARALQEEELASRKEAQTFQQEYQLGQAETQKSQFEKSLENQKTQFDKTFGLQSMQTAEQLALQRDQLRSQASAARMSGLVQLGETALTGASVLGQTEFGKNLFSGVGSGISNLLGTGQTAATTGGSAISTNFSPALTSDYGALETAGVSGVGTAASAGSSVVGGIAGGVSTAMPYYGLAKLGGAALTSTFDGSTVAGQVGESLSNPLNVEQYWVSEVAPNAPGVVKTALDALNPIAPIERFVSKVFSGGTILCTELHRQGLVSKQLVAHATVYKKRHLTEDNYQDYLRVFTPIVSKMQRSSFVSKLVAPYGKCLFNEVASKVSRKYKSTITGRVIFCLTWAFCKTVGRIHSWLS